MKRYKITLFAMALLCSGAGFAQERNQPTTKNCSNCGAVAPGVSVFHYVTNNQRHYVVGNCVPNSDVELYNSPDGGTLVASTIANAKGEAHFYIDNELPVAFAINHNRVNELGVAGTGMVMPVDQPGVVIRNTDVSRTTDEVLLNWNATVATGDWVFVIQKSEDNIHFTDAATVAARSAGTAAAYSWTDKQAADQPAVVYYRVEARNHAGNKAATDAAAVKGNGKALFAVQPTVFESVVQLSIAADKLPASYIITDVLGRNKYATGVVNSPRQNIRLTLPTGTYALSVTDNKARRSSQIIIRK